MEVNGIVYTNKIFSYLIHLIAPVFHSYINPAIIIVIIEENDMSVCMFDCEIMGIGRSMMISTSNSMKIRVILKNCSEKEVRVIVFGLKPHSNGFDLFLFVGFVFFIEIIRIIIIVVMIIYS